MVELKEIKRIAEKKAKGQPLTAKDLRAVEKYRRSRSSAPPLQDVYPSMQALSAATGIPVPVIRRAKKSGCPAFHASNRVNFRVLLRWLFETQQDGNGESLEDAERRERIARANLLELEHKTKINELVPLEKVDDILRRWYAPVFNHLRTQPDRLAARVNPSDPEHARQILTEERAALFKLAHDAD